MALEQARIRSHSAGRSVPNNLGGTVQCPIKYARFLDDARFSTNTATAARGADAFNAPVFASGKLESTADYAVVALDPYDIIKITPLLRHASAVSNTTATIYVWLLWGGNDAGGEFLRGEYRGSYALTAGSKVLASGDPVYLSTAQTAHCDTIVASTDAAPIDDPVITGGATAAQQRRTINLDQEGAFAVVIQVVNASGVSTAIEIGQM